MAEALVFVGIDVAQSTLDVAVRPTGEVWQVANDEIAFGDLVNRLRALNPTLIVLEATGRMHVPVVGALAAAACRWSRSIHARSETSAKPSAS